MSKSKLLISSTLLIIIAIISMVISPDSITADVVFNEITTDKHIYDEYKSQMNELIQEENNKMHREITPVVSVAPTIECNDNYADADSDRGNIEIDESDRTLLPDYFIYFQDKLLGIYVNNAGEMRVLLGYMDNNNIRIKETRYIQYTNDNTYRGIYMSDIIKDRPMSQDKYRKDIAQLTYNIYKDTKYDEVEDSIKRFFTERTGKEYFELIQEIKGVDTNGQYEIQVDVGKTNDRGRAVYQRIYRYGARAEVIDIVLMVGADNKVYDICVL